MLNLSSTGKYNIYIGKGIGRKLLYKLKTAKKRVIILSPFVSDSYRNIITELRNRGIYAKLYEGKNRHTKFFYLFLFLIAFSLFLLTYSIFYALISILFAILIYFIDKKLATSNLHSKIYIIDDYVILGSINFTYFGFNKNHESFVEIKNKEIADKIARHIEKTF